MKKFLALMLTLCMALSLLPVSAMAARLHDDAPVAETALGDEAVTVAKPAAAARPMAEEDEAGTQAVAKIGDAEYATLAEAVAAAQDGDTVKLLADVTVNETYASNASLEIRKALTIDGQGQFTITCAKKFGIRIFGVSEDEETMKVVLKNVTVTNANALGRAVETRGGNVELELDNATLTTTGGGNTQVLTVGGNRANATTVTIQNGSKLIASQAGYGIITFNPVDMTIDNSAVSGYGALYMKGPDSSAGSAGSVVNIVNGAKVSSAGIAGSSNTFGTLVFQEDDITVNVKDATVEATADPSDDPPTPQAVILFSSYSDPTGVVVNISGDSHVNMVNACAVFVRGKEDQNTITISDGTFSDDVTEYCVEGYKAALSEDGLYRIVEKVYVAQVGEDKYETIREALAAAGEGDTVTIVKGGEYPALTGSDVIPDGVTLKAADGVEVTFTGSFTGTTGKPAVKRIGANVTLENLTFADPKPLNYHVGDNLTVRNCHFIGDGSGTTAMYIHTPNITVDGCTFENYKRGYYTCGDNHAAGKLTFTDNTFVNVTLPFDGYWGKPATDDTKITITGNKFSDGSYVQLWDYTQYLKWSGNKRFNDPTNSGYMEFGTAINAEIKGNTGDVTVLATHCDWFVPSVIDSDVTPVYTRLVKVEGLAKDQQVTAVPVNGELIGFEDHTTSNKADANGNARFYYLPEGAYTVEIDGIEYSCIVSAPRAGEAYGETLTLKVIEDHTHSWNEVKVTVEPTCTEAGEKIVACEGCGSAKTETVAALGHTDAVIEHVDATCTEPGVVGGTYCASCGEGKEAAEEAIPATGHAMTAWAFDETNHWHVCEVCGEKDEAEEAAAHTWVRGTVFGRRRTDTCACGAERTVTVNRPTTTVEDPENTPEEDLNDPDVPLTGLPLLFADVSTSDWFYDAVKYISAKDIMKGTNGEGTRFSPELNTTRGSIATILHRLENTPDAEMADFDDVLDGKWYTDAVNWTDANGLMIGFEDGTFRPEDNVTREQLVTVLYRYAKRMGRDVTAAADLSAFADVDNVSGWAADAMSWAVSAGLIRGRNGSALAPQGVTTRGELAIILQRFLEMK